MISINTNISSLIIQNSLKTSTSKLNQAIEKMSTGYKVNRAGDNAANFSITTNMNTRINSYQVAEENAAMGLDLINTAGENLDLIYNNLRRIRALAEQSANGTYGAESLKAVNAEVNARVDEMIRLYNTTEYNGIKTFGEISEPTFTTNVTQRDTSTMTPLASVDEEGIITNGIYSISTAEELAKLSRMAKDHIYNTSGSMDGSLQFVLASDIDLSEYSSGEGWVPINDDGSGNFTANFDGNGYTIKNLYINRPDADYQGLFEYWCGDIENLGIVNCDVTGRNYTGGLKGWIYGCNTNIVNCYVTGNVQGKDYVGGLTGYIEGGTIRSCYTNCNVSGDNDVGGLVGYISGLDFISDSYSNGNIQGKTNVGGLAGKADCIFDFIVNCYAKGDIIGKEAVGGLFGKADIYGVINNSYFQGKTIENNIDTNSFIGVTTRTLNIDDKSGTILPTDNCPYTHSSDIQQDLPNLSFQVGIDASNNSQIILNTSFTLNNINSLRAVGKSNNNNCLKTIDDMINKISAKQTEYGSAQNRLESALDEISTQYENLVSARSTLRDSDIAEVSSEYIRQQILQQASATLLSTANQTPALALQLL